MFRVEVDGRVWKEVERESVARHITFMLASQGGASVAFRPDGSVLVDCRDLPGRRA